jgi:fermentation-respiration switch protein FrsA (DUF1100 family)
MTRSKVIRVILPTLLALVVLAPAVVQADTSIAGIWQGLLVVPGGKLRVVFHITQQPDQTLKATMDSPDQGASGIKVDTAVLTGSSLHIVSVAVQGLYNGQMDGDSFAGTWHQGGMEFPLALHKIEKVVTPNRPQEAKPPYPYDTEALAYPNPSAGIALAGTLTEPKGKGPFPAVLLIAGSGPQNRNEEVFGHRPFLVIADYLTRRGVAVLRVDKRGVGGSGGSRADATSMDYKSDVLAGIAYLKTRKEVDSRHIGLLGHSEGGLIAPMAAVESPDVAFIVLLAGPGIPGDSILYLQSALILKGSGAGDSTIAQDSRTKHRIFAAIRTETDTAKLKTLVRGIIREEQAKMANGTGDTSTEAVEAQVQVYLSPWMRFFVTHDPSPVLEKVKCPVLAINGDKDVQVPAKENLPAIDEALKAGGNADYTVKEMPGLNHLFQTANTGQPSEYASIEETVSPTALKVVGDWIVKHTGGK